MKKFVLLFLTFWLSSGNCDLYEYPKSDYINRYENRYRRPNYYSSYSIIPQYDLVYSSRFDRPTTEKFQYNQPSRFDFINKKGPFDKTDELQSDFGDFEEIFVPEETKYVRPRPAPELNLEIYSNPSKPSEIPKVTMDDILKKLLVKIQRKNKNEVQNSGEIQNDKFLLDEKNIRQTNGSKKVSLHRPGGIKNQVETNRNNPNPYKPNFSLNTNKPILSNPNQNKQNQNKQNQNKQNQNNQNQNKQNLNRPNQNKLDQNKQNQNKQNLNKPNLNKPNPNRPNSNFAHSIKSNLNPNQIKYSSSKPAKNDYTKYDSFVDQNYPNEEEEEEQLSSSDFDSYDQNEDQGQVIPQDGDAITKFLEVPLQTLKDKTKYFAHKFLSLFTIIQFANSRCQATSSASQYEGFCYHQSECLEMNGTAIGFCANGYGVCCVDRHTCGESSNKNCTYFESPGYPNYYPSNSSVIPPTVTTTTVLPPLTPDPRYQHLLMSSRQEDLSLSLACTFSIYKTDPLVRMMRIDFLDLELRGPTNGTCITERLVISGNSNGFIPDLCGYNTGQHIYVDVTDSTDPLQISVLSNIVDRKRFRMRICQFYDSCQTSINCLQYYTGIQGTISTFNYDQASVFNRSVPGYFNNLNYAICIRREVGYCSITYTNVQNNVEYPFNLVNFDSNGFSTVPFGQAGVEIFNCPDDYIVINGLRLCGYKLNDGSILDNFGLNAPVTDTSAGPIVIPVRTNFNNTDRGFKLFYTQNLC